MKIEFIVSHYKHPEKLVTMLGSLQSQSSDQWVAQVIADAPYDGYEDVKNFFSKDPRFTFSELNGPHRDFGHTQRNLALGNLREEWVVMVGHDNYYAPKFVEFFLRAVVNPNIHFVFCDMVHDQVNYNVIKSAPRINRIDIGNFMTRSKYASQLRINASSTTGDGEFVEEYVKRFPGEIIYLPQVLYIHN